MPAGTSQGKLGGLQLVPVSMVQPPDLQFVGAPHPSAQTTMQLGAKKSGSTIRKPQCGEDCPADWYSLYDGATGCGGNYFGSDYYDAAIDNINCNGGNPKVFWVQGFTFVNGGVWSFVMCQPWIGPPNCSGVALLECNAGQVPVIQGCADGVDYPGCNCGANEPNSSGQGGVGGPINVASGNMFETATDFRTVGQNPLTAQRYYNSYPAYVFGAFPPWSTIYNFYYSRFGYGWRSEYDRFVAPGSAGSAPNQQLSVDAIRADGEPVHFARTSTDQPWYVAYWGSNGWSGATDPRHDLNISLTTDSNNYYTQDANDTIDQYDSTGRLNLVTYRDGYQQTLTSMSYGTGCTTPSASRPASLARSPCCSASPASTGTAPRASANNAHRRNDYSVAGGRVHC